MTSAPLEVVIVAYGDAAPLEACLSSLEGAWTPVVVDNSSSPATAAVAQTFGATYLDPGRNLGFAAGVNHALRTQHQTSSDVLLLNPDATVTPDAVRRLHQRLLEDPKLACIAPAQVDPRTNESARVGWPQPTPAGAWLEAVGLGGLRDRCDFVIGSVLVLRAAALQDVGLFDERFFLYAEEVDWQIRARSRGWEVALASDIVATHIGAGTGGDPSLREAYFHAAHERLIRKHYRTAGWQTFRTACIAGAAVRAVVPPAERKSKARFRLRLYLEGPCRAETRLRSADTGPVGPA